MSTADDRKLKHREYMRAWNSRNKDKVRSYYEKSKDGIAAQRRARIESMTPEELEAHKEAARSATRRHRERNKEKLNEQSRLNMAERRARDPERHRAYQKAYVSANKERIAVRNKQYRLENAERERERCGMIFKPGQTIAGMRESQNGLCACCKKALPTGRYCHVDHCHTTGHVRALLCHKCNTGLGLFDESIEQLQAAVDYLRSFK